MTLSVSLFICCRSSSSSSSLSALTCTSSSISCKSIVVLLLSSCFLLYMCDDLVESFETTFSLNSNTKTKMIESFSTRQLSVILSIDHWFSSIFQVSSFTTCFTWRLFEISCFHHFDFFLIFFLTYLHHLHTITFRDMWRSAMRCTLLSLTRFRPDFRWLSYMCSPVGFLIVTLSFEDVTTQKKYPVKRITMHVSMWNSHSCGDPSRYECVFFNAGL